MTLEWRVLARRRASVTRDAPPGNDDLKWVANTVTLICGDRDAVLVDTFLPDTQNAELADWLAGSGKRLSAILVTHGHGDHFFGLGLLRGRFPEARAVAAPQVVEAMRAALAPEAVKSWRQRFPGMISDGLVAAEPLPGGELNLEGHRILALDVGHTDTDHTTCVWVPSARLVAAGDTIYNGTHLYMAESDRQGLHDWLAAIDTIEALNARAVVAGHGPLDPDNSPRHVAETRRYILDFLRADEETTTPEQLYDRMLALHPDRINPGSLWGSAKAIKARHHATAAR